MKKIRWLLMLVIPALMLTGCQVEQKDAELFMQLNYAGKVYVPVQYPSDLSASYVVGDISSGVWSSVLLDTRSGRSGISGVRVRKEARLFNTHLPTTMACRDIGKMEECINAKIVCLASFRGYNSWVASDTYGNIWFFYISAGRVADVTGVYASPTYSNKEQAHAPEPVEKVTLEQAAVAVQQPLPNNADPHKFSASLDSFFNATMKGK